LMFSICRIIFAFGRAVFILFADELLFTSNASIFHMVYQKLGC